MSNNEKENPKTQKKVGAFVVSTLFTLIFIFFYFSFGSIFINLSSYYTLNRMNGSLETDKIYTNDFPYKNIFTESSEDWLPYRYGKWMTKTLISAFSRNRFYLDKLFDFTGEKLVGAEGIKETLALLITPLIMIGLVFISNIAGFISTWVGAISNIGMVMPSAIEIMIMAIPLLIPLFIYPFFLLFSVNLLGMGIGTVQMIMMIGFLFITPFMNASIRGSIINTLINNKYIIMLSFFTLTTIHAFGFLGDTAGYVSLGMSIAGLVAYIIMKLIRGN